MIRTNLADTASVYKNETVIGNVVRDFARGRVFICSKVGPSEMGSAESVYAAALASLERLQIESLDLYLLHWPGKQGVRADSPENATIRLSAWRALEKLLAEGKTRAIGVSNFTVEHLRHLLLHATVAPSVNQVELHPLCPQHSLRAFCARHDIQVVAYSSLGQSKGKDILFRHPTIVDIAASTGRSPAQILLRYATQQGISVIPKGSSREHLFENISSLDFDLTAADLARLEAISDGGEHHFCWYIFCATFSFLLSVLASHFGYMSLLRSLCISASALVSFDFDLNPQPAPYCSRMYCV